MSGSASLGVQAQIEAVKKTALYLHLAIFLDNRDIVGDETFRLVGFTGSESVSEPFEFALELHGNDGVAGRKLLFDQLIGQPVTFAVSLPIADSQETSILESSERFQRALSGGPGEGLSLYNGIVAAFAMGAPGIYQLTVRPALWRLTLANRYLIYEDMTIGAAIKAVLAHHHITPDLGGIEGLALARTQDWLQAGETDYEFLRRLMGKAHLFYYFRHGARGHEIVFANRPEYPAVMAGRPLRYTFTDAEANGLTQIEVIGDYRYQQSLSITGVHTLFTRQEESWQVDEVPRILQFEVPPSSDGPQTFAQHKVFQYGSGKLAAKDFSRRTAQASRTAASQLSGQSYCPLFHVAYSFTMTGEEAANESGATGRARALPVRPSLIGRPFVLTKVEHEATLDGGYKNRFEATEAEGLVTAFSLADTQQGFVLATVVAHADSGRHPSSWKYYEKIDLDPQTQRYLDSESEDQSQLTAQGVYVRLATDPEGTRRWVKLAAHMQTAPEVGAQVLVARSNDESELPELQQIVQGGGTKVVTPSTWTASTHVGSAYNTRYGDGITIGFGAGSKADLGRAIGIATTAYKSERFHESSYGQGASYGFTTSEATAKSSQQDLAQTYGPHGPTDDVLGVNESFGSSFGRRAGKVQSELSDYDIVYSKNRTGTSESYARTDGTAYSESTHSGRVTNKTTINAASESAHLQIGDSSDSKTQIGTSTTTTRHTGDIVNTTTVLGVSSTTDTITTRTATSTIGTSTNQETIDISSQDSTVGVQSSSSQVGIANHTNMVGMSTQQSMSGITTELSLTGASNHNSVAAVSSQNTMAGISSSLSVAGLFTDVSMRGTVIEAAIAGDGVRFHSDNTLRCDLTMMEVTVLVSVKIVL